MLCSYKYCFDSSVGTQMVAYINIEGIFLDSVIWICCVVMFYNIYVRNNHVLTKQLTQVIHKLY